MPAYPTYSITLHALRMKPGDAWPARFAHLAWAVEWYNMKYGRAP
jgi:hypothetical protein